MHNDEVVVIGSVALSQYYEAFGIRAKTPVDLDIIGTYSNLKEFIDEAGYDAKEENNGVFSVMPIGEDKLVAHMKDSYSGRRIIEAEIAWADSTIEWIIDYVRKDPATDRTLYLEGKTMTIPSLDVLYAFKMSHRFLKDSPAFSKTMQDIRNIRKILGTSEIKPELMDWYARRVKETYDYGHPNLNQGKGTFFDGDDIKYVYDHDTIHEVMAIGDQPAYKSFKPPENEVMVRKDMWDECDYETRIRAVIEESYVLAIERSQVPFNFEPDPMASYRKALEKVCTSITSGWFRSWAWEHYEEALEGADEDYVQKFKQGVEDGRVKPF